MHRNQVYAEYDFERNKQDDLKAKGRFQYTCADPEAGHALCLAILIEEVGEAAQALLSLPHNYNEDFAMLARKMATLGEVSRGMMNAKRTANDPNQGIGHRPDRNLGKELVQCGAVVTAWLEGYAGKVF